MRVARSEATSLIGVCTGCQRTCPILPYVTLLLPIFSPFSNNTNTPSISTRFARRRVIEDFHSSRFNKVSGVKYYGLFDGHNGNLAAKFTARNLYHEVSIAHRNNVSYRI